MSGDGFPVGLPFGAAVRHEWAMNYAARAARFWRIRYRVSFDAASGLYVWGPKGASS